MDKFGNTRPYPGASAGFADLLNWHLDHGTREGGQPDRLGKPWTDLEFGEKVGRSKKTIENWRAGRNHPNDEFLPYVEKALFGEKSDAYANWRVDLHTAPKQTPTPSPSPRPPIDLASRIEKPPPYFLGRDDDVTAILNALRASPNHAAILVHGGPGIGKTTLTRAVANHPEIVERFGETNRWFVALETAGTAEAMKDAIIRAIARDPAQGFAAALNSLAGKPGLLVLDNLETPWDPKADRRATEGVLAQLAAVPGLAILASFRGQDRVGGIDWALDHPVAALNDDASAKLFGRIANHDFSGDPHLGLFIQALGGIPLAIELVAARAYGDTSLAGLWRQWQKIGADLAAHPDYDPARLTSLPASIELSLASSRMTPAAHRLFRLLGQLPAGLADEDRDALLGGTGFAAGEALRRIGLAVTRAGRLDLLPPIRDYAARNHRPEPPDCAAWPNHFLILTRIRGETIGTAAGAGAVAQLLPELPNIEAAIRAALIAGNQKDAIAAGEGLYRLAYVASSPTAVLSELAVACHENLDILSEANFIHMLGTIALTRSDNHTARKAFEQVLPLFRQVGNVLGEANCTFSLAGIAHDRDAAREAFEQALLLFRQIGSVVGEANCLLSLSDIALERSDLVTAHGMCEQALPLYRQVENLLGEANCIECFAIIALRRVDFGVANECFQRALGLFQQVGSVLGEANCVQGLGDIAIATGDIASARHLLRQALNLFLSIHELNSIAETHHRLASITNDDERARHIAAAREAWTTIDRPDLVAELHAEFG